MKEIGVHVAAAHHRHGGPVEARPGPTRIAAVVTAPDGSTRSPASWCRKRTAPAISSSVTCTTSRTTRRMIGNVKLSDRARQQPVGHALGPLQRRGRAGGEGGGELGGARGLDRDDAAPRAGARRRRRRCRREARRRSPAPAPCSTSGRCSSSSSPQVRLAGDHVGVIEGRDHHQAFVPLDRFGALACCSRRSDGPGEDHLAAVAPDAVDLDPRAWRRASRPPPGGRTSGPRRRSPGRDCRSTG